MLAPAPSLFLEEAVLTVPIVEFEGKDRSIALIAVA